MIHSGELESMQGTREEFTRKPELEKEKIPDLDLLVVGSRGDRDSEDSGPWAEAARVSVWVENNITKRTT